MDIKALVLYRGHYALYVLTREAGSQIFTARLKRYDGDSHSLPPPCITLTRSVRNWIGSTDEHELVEELGEIIQINLESGIPIREADGTGAMEEEA